MNKHPGCWCGNRQLVEFSPEYYRCDQCETLVVKTFPSDDLREISDESSDLYGANYAERHLQEDYGLPDFATRARKDLSERCLYWLQTILRYKLPPAELLELGSFHGGFVGLAKLAGYRARGLELSTELGRQASVRFGIEVLAGSIEAQDIAHGTLDVIALFDVLEHLQNPRETLQRCRQLLRADGILVIQTPRYREGRTFSEMTAANDSFLVHFKPVEHLYLFSRSAAERLLKEVGLPHIEFEPAVFGHYDMFPFASASALKRVAVDLRDAALMSTPGGRFTTALLDLNERVAISIQEQAGRLSAQEAEIDRRLSELRALYPELDALRNERNLLAAQMADLKSNFEVIEADRIARGRVIQEQGDRLSTREAEIDRRLSELRALYPQLEALKNERNLLTAQIADLKANFDAVEADRIARGDLINRQGKQLSAYEAEINRRLAEINAFYPQLDALKNERNLLSAQLADLKSNFDAVESDRIARGDLIEKQGAKQSVYEAEIHRRLIELNDLYSRLEQLEKERSFLAAQVAELKPSVPTTEPEGLAGGR